MSWRSPLRVAQDWSRKKALKEQLLQAIKMLPHGSPDGVDLPADDPLYAVAAQELLKEKPGLRVVRSGKGLSFTLMRAEGVSAGSTTELQNQLTKDGRLLSAGAVLYDDL